MTKATLVASISALALAGAAPAFAQSDMSAQAGAARGSDPRSLTCAQLSAYDTATVPGVLYFLSGVRAGEQMSGSMSGGATAGGDQTDAMQSADADSSGSATASGDGSDSASEPAMDPNLQLNSLTGYFTIPVEQVMIACDTSPDRNVAELLDEQSRQSGMSGDQSEMTGSVSGSSNSSRIDDILPKVYGQNPPDLGNLTEDNSEIVGITSMASATDDQGYSALDQTMQSSSPDALLAEVRGNTVLSSQLESQGYAVEDVLAVVRENNGDYTVYVDDRSN